MVARFRDTREPGAFARRVARSDQAYERLGYECQMYVGSGISSAPNEMDADRVYRQTEDYSPFREREAIAFHPKFLTLEPIPGCG